MHDTSTRIKSQLSHSLNELRGVQPKQKKSNFYLIFNFKKTAKTSHLILAQSAVMLPATLQKQKYFIYLICSMCYGIVFFVYFKLKKII